MAPANTTYAIADIHGNSIVVADATNQTKVRLAQPSLEVHPRGSGKAKFVVRVPGGAQGVVNVRVRTAGGSTVATGPLGNGQLFTATGNATASAYRAEASIDGALSNHSAFASLGA